MKIEIFKDNRLTHFRIISILILFGLLLGFVFSFSSKYYLLTLSIILAIKLTAFIIGGLIGFLFGIPRTLQKNLSNDDLENTKYQANTNLEQISDWLTKILIGIGLTQLSSVPQMLESMSEFIASGLGGVTYSKIYAGAAIVSFSILGFFFVYLWARLQLGRALVLADGLNNPEEVRELISTLDNIEPKVDGQNKEELALVINKLENQLGNISIDKDFDKRLKELANSYIQIRASFPPGKSRTSKMGAIVAEARAIANKIQVDPRPIFQKGGDGDRIVAIAVVRALPRSTNLDIITNCIGESRSAFEQYQGLRAAEKIYSTLTSEDKEKIKQGIERAIQNGTLTNTNVDRWDISSKLLSDKLK